MSARYEWQQFAPRIVEQLFAAIDVDDVVEEQVPLPEQGMLLCIDDQQVRQCYALCLQLWLDGVSREALLELLAALRQHGELTPDEQRRFKILRAKFKHLRFAQRIFGRRHRCVRLLHHTTVMMGRLQDALRGGHRRETERARRRLALLMSPPVWALMQHRAINLQLDSASSICAYRRHCFARLEPSLEAPALHGSSFHATRKIVSQQVAFYDTFRTLYPENEVARRMSRFMAAINGLMGDRHDEIIAATLRGERGYEDSEPLGEDIRWRLEKLITALRHEVHHGPAAS